MSVTWWKSQLFLCIFAYGTALQMIKHKQAIAEVLFCMLVPINDQDLQVEDY